MFHIKIFLTSWIILFFVAVISLFHNEKTREAKVIYDRVELACAVVIFLEIMYAVWSIPSSSGYH